MKIWQVDCRPSGPTLLNKDGGMAINILFDIGYSIVDLGFRRHLRRRRQFVIPARFGLLENFLFLFRREFMNSTWSIGALEQPACLPPSLPVAALPAELSLPFCQS